MGPHLKQKGSVAPFKMPNIPLFVEICRVYPII